MAMSELTSVCVRPACGGAGPRRQHALWGADCVQTSVTPAKAGAYASFRARHVGIR
jgi:hypothetical protein